MICMLSRESLWSFSFCTGHYDMIYIYIYIYARGCTFYGFLYESFYDDEAYMMMLLTYIIDHMLFVIADFTTHG